LFLREAKILVTLKHPSLLQGFGMSLPKKPKDSAILWVQFAENGALDLAKLTASLKCCAAVGICKGVLFLHSNNMVHCDLKADNVLLDANLHAMIADFGSSKLFELGVTQTAPGFTPAWAAPERSDEAPAVGSHSCVGSSRALGRGTCDARN
jgi:serine/threonine protein kinase